MLVSRNFVDLITFSRASPAWRFNSSGILVQETNDVPRFEYDPVTRQPRGMLIEEARTNLAIRSAEFDNASWVKTGTATVTANTDVAPDGTTSVDTLNLPASGDRINLAAISVTGGSAVTHSIWMAGSGTVYVSLASNGGTFTSAGTLVNLTSVLTRYSVTLTTNANNTGVFPIVGRYDGTTGAGTATAVKVWGDQAEVGAFATSYIPTTTAAVSRSADSAAITDLTKVGFNPSVGTVYAEFVAPNMTVASNQSILTLSDGTTANRIQPFINAGTLTTRVTNGGIAADFSNAISGASSTHKLAIGCAAGSAALSVDGGAATQTTPSAFPSVSKLYLGAGADGISAYLNGYLRALRYYPRKLSNAELQALTT